MIFKKKQPQTVPKLDSKQHSSAYCFYYGWKRTLGQKKKHAAHLRSS